MAQTWFDTFVKPTVTTGITDSIGESSAILSGIVNPNGFNTSCYFEYGIDESYESAATTYPRASTTSMDVGSGVSDVSVSVDVTGLDAETIYYFRLVASNNNGTTYGSDKTFITLPQEIPPGGGGGGGCFIATAAFGSSLESHVKILKDFRDKYLLTNGWGRGFVEFYYRNSPQVANLITQHKILKLIMRTGLYPIIGFSYIMLHSSLGEKAVISCFFILLMIGIAFLLVWMKRKSCSITTKNI